MGSSVPPRAPLERWGANGLSPMAPMAPMGPIGPLMGFSGVAGLQWSANWAASKRQWGSIGGHERPSWAPKKIFGCQWGATEDAHGDQWGPQ